MRPARSTLNFPLEFYYQSPKKFTVLGNVKKRWLPRIISPGKKFTVLLLKNVQKILPVGEKVYRVFAIKTWENNSKRKKTCKHLHYVCYELWETLNSIPPGGKQFTVLLL